MSRAVARMLLVAGWIVVLAPACSGSDVTIATLPASEDAASPVRCATLHDCPAGTYCDKPSCSSASGTCEFFPPDCPGQEQPSCGCDGVTYFSDCLRRASGIASSTTGPCWMGTALECDGSSTGTCPQGAVCGLLTGMGPGACPPAPEGTCWVLPAQCPAPGPGGILWDACQPGPRCLDTCTALRAGGAYRGSQRCP